MHTRVHSFIGGKGLTEFQGHRTFDALLAYVRSHVESVVPPALPRHATRVANVRATSGAYCPSRVSRAAEVPESDGVPAATEALAEAPVEPEPDRIGDGAPEPARRGVVELTSQTYAAEVAHGTWMLEYFAPYAPWPAYFTRPRWALCSR